MFNKKYFILVFFVFLIAITSVSAQDDAVASQDLNELSFNNAALKTMKEDHGSINQFIKNGLHISMKEKQQFKDKILE